MTPTSGATALATLTQGAGTATVQVDPNADTSGWPAGAVTMNEYLPGTNDGANPKLGSNDYREYRAISEADGTDYELQVWNWTDSYGAQFRDNPSLSEADRQAWFYGGTATNSAAMPTSGVANYSGEWGGTAKSANWAGTTPVNMLDPNRLWTVRGTTNLSADFTAGTMTGVLTTDEWRTFDDNAVEVIDRPRADEDVFINATISGNRFSGQARYGNTAVQGDNPAHGGFFGAAANEVTGAFNVHATYVGPLGGDIPINDDRRGYMDISGVFNGRRP